MNLNYIIVCSSLDGSFVVTNLKREDAGWYKCRPTNGIGLPMERVAYLNVTCKYLYTVYDN